MHLALLLSYAIILCNLGSVATGPRSKKRGKSDIHQEGAGLFDPRSGHDHLISSSTFRVFRTYLRVFLSCVLLCTLSLKKQGSVCVCKHGLFYFTIWTVWTKPNLYNKFDLHIYVSIPSVLLLLFSFPSPGSAQYQFVVLLTVSNLLSTSD